MYSKSIELTDYLPKGPHISPDCYSAVISWCYDQGYARVRDLKDLQDEIRFLVDADLFYDAGRVVVKSRCWILQEKIKKVWIDDKTLSVINPRYKHNTIMHYNGMKISEVSKWLDENINVGGDKDMFGHIYYTGAVRNISFYNQEDLIFYKMVFGYGI